MSYSLSFSKSILVVIFISDKIRLQNYEFISTADISKYLCIPKPTLVKILQNLHSANIIETKEGKNGGVRLMKEASKISILNIFEAMEKGKGLFHTSYNILSEGKRPSNAQKSIKNILINAENKMKMELSCKSIEDILIEMND